MPFLKNIGTAELVVIGIILIFLFGGKKLSEWARGFGEASREMKKIQDELTSTNEGESKNRRGVE